MPPAGAGLARVTRKGTDCPGATVVGGNIICATDTVVNDKNITNESV
jgi:hypothetical protein